MAGTEQNHRRRPLETFVYSGQQQWTINKHTENCKSDF
jgi:hypothetical protein